MSLDDLGFDPFDDRLGNELRAVAPSAPKADQALGELRPRFARARQRRRAAVAGAWGLAGAGALALGLVFVGSGATNRIDTPPASQPDRGTTTTPKNDVPTSTDPTAVVPGTEPDGTTVTTDDHGGNQGSGADEPDGDNGDGGSGSGSGSGGDDD